MITIIVLLILAGVTVATLMGENGLLAKAANAREETKKAEAIEDVKLRIMEVQAEKEGKATLEDLVEYLENNTTNEYKITKVSGGTASLVEGSIESSEVGNAEKIYITSVKYGYEVEVNSNMTVTERVVASSGSSSWGSGSESEEGTGGTSEELESLREEYENFRKAVAQSIEDAGGTATSYNANATTFDTNIKGILTEVTKNDTAEAEDIADGKTAHVNGAQVTGNANFSSYTVTSLGYGTTEESTPFDATGIEGWRNLTVDNFFMKNVCLHWDDDNPNVVANFDVSSDFSLISYNNTTGVVTVQSAGDNLSGNYYAVQYQLVCIH